LWDLILHNTSILDCASSRGAVHCGMLYSNSRVYLITGCLSDLLISLGGDSP